MTVVLGLVLNGDEEKTIAAKTDADQSTVYFFANVTMQTESISWRIEVNDGGLRFHSREKSPNKSPQGFWKGGWLRVGVGLIRPVILTS